MNKDTRSVYLVLAEEARTALCPFCAHAEFYGDCSDPCCVCKFRFRDRFSVSESLSEFGREPGEDCWGFRASLLVSDVADIVGTVLAKDWKHWSWWPTDKRHTEVRVAGIRGATLP